MTEPENTSDRPEPVLHRTAFHWAILMGPALLLILGGVSLRSRLLAALIMIGLAVLWGIWSILVLRASEFVLTASKLVIRVGFLFKRFYEYPYSKIGGTEFFQPALGFLLGFGKLVIVRPEGKPLVFRLVARPDVFVSKLKEEILRAREQMEPADDPGDGKE